MRQGRGRGGPEPVWRDFLLYSSEVYLERTCFRKKWRSKGTGYREIARHESQIENLKRFRLRNLLPKHRFEKRDTSVPLLGVYGMNDVVPVKEIYGYNL